MTWMKYLVIACVILLGIGLIYLIANIGKPDW